MTTTFDSSYLAFFTFTFVLVVTPGSTTAVVVRNTLEGGRRAGYLTALGAALANSTIAIACGLGLSVLISVWPGSLEAIRIAVEACPTGALRITSDEEGSELP